MKFRIGPFTYPVRITPGPIRDEGGDISAVTHSFTILIAGDIPQNERLEALIDQLWRIHQQHYGLAAQPSAVATFTIDTMRQLRAQGGEATLARMKCEGFRPTTPPQVRREAA